MENLIENCKPGNQNDSAQNADRLDITLMRQRTQDALKERGRQAIEEMGDSLIERAYAGNYDFITHPMDLELQEVIRAHFESKGYSVEKDLVPGALCISWGP
jgi:hypothetical protein